MTQIQLPLFALPPAEDEIAIKVKIYKERSGLYCATLYWWMAWGKTRAAARRNVVKRFKEDYGSIYSR